MEPSRIQIRNPTAWSTSLLIIGAFQTMSYIMLYEDLQLQCLKLFVTYYGKQCRTYVEETIIYTHDINSYTIMLRKAIDTTLPVPQNFVAHVAIKLDLIAHISSLINITSTSSLRNLLPGSLQRGLIVLFHGLCQAEENLDAETMWDMHQVLIRKTLRIIELLQTTAEKLHNSCRQWIQLAPNVVQNLPRNIREVLAVSSQVAYVDNLADEVPTAPLD